MGRAELDDAAQHVVVVPQAQLDLHRVDAGDALRLFDLADGDVAQTNAVDQPAAPQRVQRAHARRERHARIRRVQLIEVDSFDAQGDQARFARRGQRAGAAVGFPSPLGPGQAALGRDADAGTVPAPRSQRAGNEPFVVAGFRGVEAVGVGRVEERDTRVQRSVQHLDPAGLVAIGGGREAHAADRDRRLHHCKSNLSDRKVGGCGPGCWAETHVTAADATAPATTLRARRADGELCMVAPKHITAPGRLRAAKPQRPGIGRILASPAFLSPRPTRPSPHQKLSCVRWRGLLLFESRLRGSDNRAGRLERALGLSELPILVCRHYGEES